METDVWTVVMQTAQFVGKVIASPTTVFALALFQIALAFYVYRKRPARPILCYEDLDIPKRESVEIGQTTVVGLKLVMWNNGPTTITKNLIAAKDPLVIRTSNCSPILFVDVASTSSKGCDAAISIPTDNQSVATVSFEYLEPHDWVVFTILYLGDVIQHLRMNGHLIGIGSPFRSYSSYRGLAVALIVSQLLGFLSIPIVVTAFFAGSHLFSTLWFAAAITILISGALLFPVYLARVWLPQKESDPTRLAEFIRPPSRGKIERIALGITS